MKIYQICSHYLYSNFKKCILTKKLFHIIKITSTIFTIHFQEYCNFFIAYYTHIYSFTQPLQGKLVKWTIFHDICVLVKSTHVSIHREVNFHSPSSSYCLHQSLGSCSGYAIISDISQSSLNESCTEILFYLECELHYVILIILYFYIKCSVQRGTVS